MFEGLLICGFGIILVICGLVYLIKNVIIYIKNIDDFTNKGMPVMILLTLMVIFFVGQYYITDGITYTSLPYLALVSAIIYLLIGLFINYLVLKDNKKALIYTGIYGACSLGMLIVSYLFIAKGFFLVTEDGDIMVGTMWELNELFDTSINENVIYFLLGAFMCGLFASVFIIMCFILPVVVETNKMITKVEPHAVNFSNGIKGFVFSIIILIGGYICLTQALENIELKESTSFSLGGLISGAKALILSELVVPSYFKTYIIVYAIFGVIQIVSYFLIKKEVFGKAKA